MHVSEIKGQKAGGLHERIEASNPLKDSPGSLIIHPNVRQLPTGPQPKNPQQTLNQTPLNLSCLHQIQQTSWYIKSRHKTEIRAKWVICDVSGWKDGWV